MAGPRIVFAGIRLSRMEFARMKAVDDRELPDEIGSAIAVAAEKEPFSTRTDRRVRYWVDGQVKALEEMEPQSPEEIFTSMYAAIPPHVVEQMQSLVEEVQA